MMAELRDREYPGKEYWYRYSYEVDYGNAEFIAFSHKPAIRLVKELWVVQRHTPKGVWIRRQGWYDKERFVLKGARRSWAYPTPELALNSFLIRKRRQIGYLTSQLSNVTEALALAEALDAEEAA